MKNLAFIHNTKLPHSRLRIVGSRVEETKFSPKKIEAIVAGKAGSHYSIDNANRKQMIKEH